MLAPGFWDDRDHSQEIMQKAALLKNQVALFEDLRRVYDDLAVLVDLGEEEEDAGVAAEARVELAAVTQKVADLELTALFSGPYDRGGAIVALHAGAGGTEAQDWVDMLLRMYIRWAERRQYRVEVLDRLPGDEAGTKSVTVLVDGPNAFGYLQAEKGVHRLVRISPFDTAGRRHTSFASVDVLPGAEDEIDIQIDPEDLKIDTFRSGGAGGQHVNKTDSAVRITHLPTGVVVSCQNERSQLANRLAAMKLLKAKILDLELKKKEAELAALRGEQPEIAWGSQIRSYVFHPYSLVKDHRTGAEAGNVSAVMDGAIDDFIAAYLRSKSRN